MSHVDTANLHIEHWARMHRQRELRIHAGCRVRNRYQNSQRHQIQEIRHDASFFRLSAVQGSHQEDQDSAQDSCMCLTADVTDSGQYGTTWCSIVYRPSFAAIQT